MSIIPQLKNNEVGAGPLAEWLSSRTPLQAAQCFIGSNPEHGHGTAHRATYVTTRRTHKEEYTTIYRGALGIKRKKIKSLKKR